MQTRRTILGATLGFFAGHLAAAQGTKRKKKGQAIHLLRPGDDCTLQVVGGEDRLCPKAKKAGALGSDYMLFVCCSPGEDAELQGEKHRLFLDALRLGDRALMDQLVQSGAVFKIAKETKAIVIFRAVGAAEDPNYFGWTLGPDGTCRVRIQDGPATGKEVLIPARNLRYAP